MRHTLLPRIASFVLVLLVAATARAQVFIPDTLVRAWLNQSIPGIVDANGIMDTTHAGIAGCDSVMWQRAHSIPLIDTIRINLSGVQYLDFLVDFRINYSNFPPSTHVVIDIPEIRSSIDGVEIWCFTNSSSISFPPIDHPMNYLYVQCGSFYPNGSFHLDAIKDTINTVAFRGMVELSCDDFSGYINNLYTEHAYSNDDSLDIVFNDWNCNNMIIDAESGGLVIVDFQQSVVSELIVSTPSFKLLNLPNTIETLDIQEGLGDPFDQIPPLPPSLKSLGIVFTTCVPPLPDGLESLFILAGADCIPNIPSSLQTITGPFINGGDTILCSILNSDCPGTAAAIAGRHAIDDNSNGLWDAGEPIFPWGRVLIQPMNALVPAGADGWWERGAQPGTYSIEPNSTYPYLLSSAPAQHSATFAALGEVDSTNHFAHILLPGVNDLEVSAYAAPPRPGFDNNLTLSYRNFGTTTLPATLQLAVDADQSFVSSSPAPTMLVGNSATWDLGTLPLGASGQVAVTLHTDATVPLGTPVQHAAVIDPVAGDTVPANNTTLWTDTVVGAYDPNDKLLDIPAATPADVQADAVTLTYTIRFQNTGTYPAERVVILDTLSDDLQWNSFELLSSSHPCQWYMLDGVLHFVFDPILLPDSGSNEPASHGFVRFRMRPSTQLNNGDQVDNIAHIIFDFNTPIVTPPATFRVDVSTDVEHPAASAFTLMPNPTHDRLLISGLTGAATVRLLDLSGRLLRTLRVNAPALVDVGDLATGTYLLEVRSQEVVGSVRFAKE